MCKVAENHVRWIYLTTVLCMGGMSEVCENHIYITERSVRWFSLASPRPPVDPDDINAHDTLRALEELRSQPNDTCIPQIFKMQCLHK